MAECQLPKLDVAGSNPVGRSKSSEGLRGDSQPLGCVDPGGASRSLGRTCSVASFSSCCNYPTRPCPRCGKGASALPFRRSQGTRVSRVGGLAAGPLHRGLPRGVRRRRARSGDARGAGRFPREQRPVRARCHGDRTLAMAHAQARGVVLPPICEPFVSWRFRVLRRALDWRIRSRPSRPSCFGLPSRGRVSRGGSGSQPRHELGVRRGPKHLSDLSAVILD